MVEMQAESGSSRAVDWTDPGWREQFDSDVEAYLAHPVTLDQMAQAVRQLDGVDGVELVHGWIVLDLGGGEVVGLLDGDVHVGGWCLALGQRRGSELIQISWPALLSDGHATAAQVAERAQAHMSQLREIVALAPAATGDSWPQLIEQLGGQEPVTTAGAANPVLDTLRLLSSDAAR